jgi:hypothetical protein
MPEICYINISSTPPEHPPALFFSGLVRLLVFGLPLDGAELTGDVVAVTPAVPAVVPEKVPQAVPAVPLAVPAAVPPPPAHPVRSPASALCKSQRCLL